MLLQSRYGQNGDTAIFMSPMRNITSSTQLSFQFHMKMPVTDFTAKLEVFLVTALGLPLLKAFSTIGNNGDNWIEENICLPNGSYVIMFRGTQGKTFESDIGLDNISVEEGGCDSPMRLVPQGKHKYPSYFSWFKNNW